MSDDISLPAKAASTSWRTTLSGLCAIAVLLPASATLWHWQWSTRADASIARGALSPMPDFKSFNTTEAKKEAFFQWLTPYIERENRRIETTRQHILALQRVAQLNDADRQWLADTAAYYDVAPAAPNSPLFWQALLRRVDVVPVSLALAQAANESGWGTSRFTLLANNLFGEWCFHRGCGIVPANRPAGQFHEVRKFPDVADSVRSYLHNLNTHNAFAALRRKRAAMRNQEQKLSGSQLVQGLLRYSARGDDYIREIWSMIRHNRLERFDKHSYLIPRS